MGLLIALRRRSDATLSASEAACAVGALGGVTLLNQSGDNLLVEGTEDDVARLEAALPGWIVAPQRSRIPVPDTRRTIR